MIWLVGKDLGEYRPLINTLSTQKIFSKEYNNLSDVLRVLDQMPDAIIIDVDGIEALSLEFCWIVNHNLKYKKANIIFFSSNNDSNLEVSAFEAGVSDFILKPFKKEAAISRIQSRLNIHSDKHVIRTSQNGETIFEINKEDFSVLFKDSLITLSKKEFELLYVLAANPGKVFGREELYKKIWSSEYDPKDRSIDVHILRLRKKLDENIITTLKGIGYRFNLKT
jgi:two-component system alkaline phosphatase synthesis response regulator PhoP